MRLASTPRGRAPVFKQRLLALEVGQSFTTAIKSNANASRTQAHAAAKRLGIKVKTESSAGVLTVTRTE